MTEANQTGRQTHNHNTNNNIADMNNNLKNLVEISKNQIEGL